MQNLQSVRDLADYRLSREELEVLRGFEKVLLSNLEWPEKKLNPRFIWLAGEAGLGPIERRKLAYMVQVIKRRARHNRNIMTGRKLLVPAILYHSFAWARNSSPKLLDQLKLRLSRLPYKELTPKEFMQKLLAFFRSRKSSK